MKKSLSVFVLTVCFATFTNAQNFSYGVKAGVNSSTISFTNDNFETSSVLGFHAGVFGQFAVTEKFSVQPELLFYTGGNEESVGQFSGEISTTNLIIPVLAQYEVAPGLLLEAGPHYNLLLSIEEEFGSGSKTDISEFYKSGVLGVSGGASYMLSSLVEGLRVGIRYTADLSEINDQDVNGGELKRRDLFITFSYALSK